MSHWLTERCGLLPAPDGLALVQDLLNTREIGPGGTDLLDNATLVRTWLPDVLESWASDTGRSGRENEWATRLSERELAGLRALRATVLRLVEGELPAVDGSSTNIQVSKTELRVTTTGEIRLEPTGSGWHQLEAAIWLQVYLAQQNGAWGRLKICRNPVCGSAFFDRSRNNSGAWHDVKVCGNAANLRASRARKRLAATGAGSIG